MKNKIIKPLIISTAITLSATGCSQKTWDENFIKFADTTKLLPSKGNIKVSKSDFDGSQIIRLVDTVVYKQEDYSPQFDMPLSWSSKSPDKIYFLPSVSKITNLSKYEGLRFNIDGKVINLNATDSSTSFNYGNSSRIFEADINILKDFINAQSVKVQLSSIYEGNLKVNRINSVILGLPDFIAKINEVKGEV